MHELIAPPQWRRIEFLSDLHLQRETPAGFAALASHLCRTDADAVFILGDLFESWVGDDAGLEGFEAECLEMLHNASERLHIGFMVGNRDFLLGSASWQRAGLRHLPDPTLVAAFGQRVLLTHGDELCRADEAYQAFRREVRSPAWQASFLARPLAERQAIARHMRAESQRRRTEQGEHVAEAYGDIDREEACAWLREAGAGILIHGHTHQPSHDTLADGLERFVLSDWDYDAPMTAPRGDVLRWSHECIVRTMPLADRAGI